MDGTVDVTGTVGSSLAIGWRKGTATCAIFVFDVEWTELLFNDIAVSLVVKDKPDVLWKGEIEAVDSIIAVSCEACFLSETLT
jgi:hypothetical protein